MWVLQLNDMRSPKIEILAPVCRGETEAELREFLAREKVEPYSDGSWGKCYRQGGPLEWFNEPFEDDAYRHFVNVGTREDAARRWDEQVLSLPTIPLDLAVSADKGSGG